MTSTYRMEDEQYFLEHKPMGIVIHIYLYDGCVHTRVCYCSRSGRALLNETYHAIFNLIYFVRAKKYSYLYMLRV